MNLDSYLIKVETAVDLANKLSVTPGFVCQLRSGFRPVPIDRCVPIEQATSGLVTRKDLRPKDWHKIWPELAQQENDSEKAA